MTALISVAGVLLLAWIITACLSARIKKRRQIKVDHDYDTNYVGLRNPIQAVTDDGYSSFVRECWGLPGHSLNNTVVKRQQEATEHLVNSTLHSVVQRLRFTYVNTVEDGQRKTFASERHKWFRDGVQFDSSAFDAVRYGVEPDNALRHEPYPTSFDDAVTRCMGRGKISGKSFVLHYQSKSGDESFRVISGIRLHPTYVSARCHFRYGNRRYFLNKGIIETMDTVSGEIHSRADFLFLNRKKATSK